jgi:hypothetical protein
MKKSIIIIPLLGLLVGCQPPLTRDQQLAIYRSRCLDYGYQWGTPEFADCMMKQEARHEKIAVEMRKAQAMEQSNWIAEENAKAKEREFERKRKKRKH